MKEFELPIQHPLHLKTLLALDFGEKFIGVAIYCINRDPYPTPYGRIANKGTASVVKELNHIIEQEMVDLLIVGLPHLTDGKATSSTQRAKEFLSVIKEQISIPVEAQDETLSTFEAESRMKASPQYNFQVDLSKIDAVAATVILEDFIRRKKEETHL